MSAVRVRTPGNLPETRIFCDSCDRKDDSRDRSRPVVGYDARDARKVARRHGWRRSAGWDWCPPCGERKG